MSRPSFTAIRPLLPAFGLAVGLPMVIRGVLPLDEVGDFAMAGLGLGCAVLAARACGFGLARKSSTRPNDPDRPLTDAPGMTSWPRVAALSLAAAAIFVLLNPASPDHAGLPIPLLALLTLSPALGIVPYLTLGTGKPFAAVVLTAFIVGLIKLASCVVVRIVHGPNALADGYMAGDWQTAKLMISLFWIGTVSLSLALGLATHRPGSFCFFRSATA